MMFFIFLKIVSTLTNGANSDEMLHFVAFHQGHQFAKVHVLECSVYKFRKSDYIPAAALSCSKNAKF